MITFQQVSKRYNNCLALDNISFHVAPGEMAFLTGPSGAGKSTVINLIAAIETASQGHIVVANQSLHHLKARRIPYLRRRIGMILQNPELLNDRSIFDNVALPLVIAGSSYHDAHSRVRAVLAKMNLNHKEHAYPFELSGGEKQRVAIARAIVNKPSLLLADEPLRQLDSHLASETMDLFEQFNRLGMTILIASHNLSLINQLKHRVLSLTDGTLCSNS